MRYPDAPRSDDHDVLHGTAVPDPYRWLEDPAHDGTRAWQAAQRDLYERFRERWAHQADWSALLAGLRPGEGVSVPVIRGDRTFFARAAKDSEHAVLYVAEGDGERVLIDPSAIDPSGDTVLEDWAPSPEGDLVAYQLSVGGTEDCVLRVLDVATGKEVDGPIDRVRRTFVAWLPGGDAFYYARRLPPSPDAGHGPSPRRIHLHRLGADPEQDALVFGEGRGAAQFYSAAVTGRWLTISAAEGTAPRNELWIADLAYGDPARPPLRPIQSGEKARTHTRIAPETSPDDTMWLRTTLGAPRGRVVATTPADPGPGTWRTVIPERHDAVLRDFVPLTGDRLPHPVALVLWSRHAVSHITVHDLRDGRELSEVPLPGIGSAGFFHTRPTPGHEVWFPYSDHITSRTILHYDAATGRLRAAPPGSAGSADGTAPSAGSEASANGSIAVAQGSPTSADEPTTADGSAASATQPTASAKGRPVGVGGGDRGCRVTVEIAVADDGMPIRVFVISPAGRPDRPRPAILTGYGGFGAPMTPAYSPEILAWVGAGGVYAVACLRGGGEEGVEWHRAGMGRAKTRVFDDFDAVTDHLVEQGWTSHGRLGIVGNSNGGLLVAAAVTRHPEKYGAVACLAPLTDMVRYERSGMGPSWRPEYGTVDDPDDFAALLAYSPYHNVREGGPYPPIMVAAFDGDTRVDPAHARKFTAALQHASANPVVLRVEANVGHGGRAASRLIGLQADVLAFCGHVLGLCPEGDRCAYSCAR